MKEDVPSNCKHSQCLQPDPAPQRSRRRAATVCIGRSSGKSFVFIGQSVSQRPRHQHDSLAFAQAISLPTNTVYSSVATVTSSSSLPHNTAFWCWVRHAGKTTSIVLPNLFCANGSVLAISTKPDLLDTTAETRSRLGPVLLFDQTADASQAKTVSWLDADGHRSDQTKAPGPSRDRVSAVVSSRSGFVESPKRCRCAQNRFGNTMDVVVEQYLVLAAPRLSFSWCLLRFRAA